MTPKKEIAILRDEARGYRKEWARAESRLLEAEVLIGRAASFVDNIKVGLPIKKRDDMVKILRDFLKRPMKS